MTRVSILGGGKMGEALLAGFIDSGLDPTGLCVAEADPDRRRALEATYDNVRVVPSAAWALPDAEVVVIAVKPDSVATVLTDALDALGPDTLLVSVAAGVSLAALEALAPGRPVVRAMPNTPALVRQGAAAIAGGTHADEIHLATAEGLLRSVGTVVRVPEYQLDAVTGLSGSGPAYVFLVAEALIEAGVLEGLPRDTASALVAQTLLGAATLLAKGDQTPDQLRAAVTSPGGTTAAGLRELEANGVRVAFIDAVSAAARRSRDLSPS